MADKHDEARSALLTLKERLKAQISQGNLLTDFQKAVVAHDICSIVDDQVAALDTEEAQSDD